MCKFCEQLLKEKEMDWQVRSTYADDNIDEAVRNFWDEYIFQRENNIETFADFTFTPYLHNDNVKVSIGYRQSFKKQGEDDIIISPFSESVQFNYCPMCGKKISKTIKEFTGEEYYGIVLQEEE